MKLGGQRREEVKESCGVTDELKLLLKLEASLITARGETMTTDKA